jgi:hypothetical protein
LKNGKNGALPEGEDYAQDPTECFYPSANVPDLFRLRWFGAEWIDQESEIAVCERTVKSGKISLDNSLIVGVRAGYFTPKCSQMS